MNELDIILVCGVALLLGGLYALQRSCSRTQTLLKRRSLELQAVVTALQRCEQRFEQRTEALESELAMLGQDIEMLDRDAPVETVSIEDAVRLAKDGVHAGTLVKNGFSVAEAELAVALYGDQFDVSSDAESRGPVASTPVADGAHSRQQVVPERPRSQRSAPQSEAEPEPEPEVDAELSLAEPVGTPDESTSVAEPPAAAMRAASIGEEQFRALAAKLRAASRPARGDLQDDDLDDDLLSLTRNARAGEAVAHGGLLG